VEKNLNKLVYNLNLPELLDKIYDMVKMMLFQLMMMMMMDWNLEKYKENQFPLPNSTKPCFDMGVTSWMGYLFNFEAVLGAINALHPDANFLVDTLEFMKVLKENSSMTTMRDAR